ncbi:MAG: hypothetical protein L6428_09740 [Candidatus Aminicenantes bacterium]|nr:hypothetical protein [Candidatus Aminicenantes bacterium]
MTEALFQINNDGQLMSSTFYTISQRTLKRKLLSNELIKEIIRRVIELDQKEWSFTFEDLQVEIVKRHDYKIDFFVSRDIPKWNTDFDFKIKGIAADRLCP